MSAEWPTRWTRWHAILGARGEKKICRDAAAFKVQTSGGGWRGRIRLFKNGKPRGLAVRVSMPTEDAVDRILAAVARELEE